MEEDEAVLSTGIASVVDTIVLEASDHTVVMLLEVVETSPTLNLALATQATWCRQKGLSDLHKLAAP